MRTRHPLPDLTEASIQALLFEHLVAKGYHHIAPNCCAIGNEADLLSVTGAGFLHEYEIKISRSDFKADKKKIRKHKQYQNASHGNTTKRTRQQQIPSVFYYVVPAGLVDVSEVPPYAGFIEICTREHQGRKCQEHYLKTVKPAPRLHKEKTTDAVLRRITNSLMWKVFNGVTR